MEGLAAGARIERVHRELPEAFVDERFAFYAKLSTACRAA